MKTRPRTTEGRQRHLLRGRHEASGIRKPDQEQPRLGPVVMEASGLGLQFGGNQIFADVAIQLRQGECVLLTGENGAGKTSLINILTGNLAASSGAIQYSINGKQRTFRFPARWWSRLNPWNQFRPEFVAQAGVGRSWQDVRLFGSLSLAENVNVAATSAWGESPLAAFIPTAAARQDFDVLSNLGLGGREESSADMISLGQSKRVAIARAIAAGAKLLFLDEPLSGLDHEGVVSVVNTLRSLRDQHQLTFVIVEHVLNERHLLPLVTTEWELRRGALASRPVDHSRDRTHLQDWWLSGLKNAAAATGGQVIEESLPRNARLTRIRLGPPSIPATPALEVRNLRVSRGQRQVLGIGDDGKPAPLSLTVNRGELAVLEAPNGWGKTTLFNVFAGAQPITSGSWSVGGTLNPGFDLVNCVSSSTSQFPSLTVREVAAVAGSPLPLRWQFDFMSRRLWSSLSGGERQSLALHLSSPKLFNVYDEPINALDMGRWESFINECTWLLKKSAALLFMIPKRTTETETET